MKKHQYLLGLIAGMVFASCTKDISEGHGAGDVDERNVKMRLSYYYDHIKIDRDSMYQNNMGVYFTIDDVRLLISDFYVQNGEDTIRNEDNRFVLTSLNKREYPVVEVPSGNYNGSYGFRVGLDSLTNYTGNVSGNKKPLQNNDVTRDDIGYNYIIVKGKTFHPDDTIRTEPDMPFVWKVGMNHLLSIDYKQDKHFSASENGTVLFEVYMDMEAIFDDVNIEETPVINSDINDNDDYQAAEDLRERFINGGCLELL